MTTINPGNTINLVPKVHYLVSLGFVILDRPGEQYDEHYVEMIGSYESLEDAKKSVEEHAGLIMDNDEQYLTIYKVDLNECKLHDFRRKDLPKAVEKALENQKALEAAKKARQNATVNKSIGVQSLELTKDSQQLPLGDLRTTASNQKFGANPKDVTVDFPRPHKGLVEKSASAQTTEVLTPMTVNAKAKKLG